ncbi:MAG: methyltransferase domain-containing protein [Candidatus Thorarchaeota archaeon]
MSSYLLPAIRAYFSRKPVAIEKIPPGRILDIGGGGEGIIAQIGGDKVTAIDKLESEIEEARPKAPTATWKVEDARNLSFEDGSFDHATAFFSLMYMRKPGVTEEVLAEVFRILSPGGEFWIWDANISGTKEPFIIFLKIELPSGQIIKTGYGAKGKGKQTVDEISNLLQEIGFEVTVVSSDKAWFFLKAGKPL